MSLIFITGSGKRLGKALAISFARHGWDIILHYNQSEASASETERVIKDLGRKVIKFRADLTDFSGYADSYRHTIDKIGHPDVLVNNAAIYPRRHSLSETDLELWDKVMDSNVKACFNTAKLFAENAAKGSRIINIASLGAYQIWKGRIPYNVSKAALIQLTKALAKDLAPDIAVNSVSPGYIEIKGEEAVESGNLKIDSIPMKRYGEPDDVFDAVYFFSSCSHYITGQNINVDGGFNL